MNDEPNGLKINAKLADGTTRWMFYDEYLEYLKEHPEVLEKIEAEHARIKAEVAEIDRRSEEETRQFIASMTDEEWTEHDKKVQEWMKQTLKELEEKYKGD